MPQEVLELLQRIAENPPIGRAMPILRIEHGPDLLACQHGKHVDGEDVPQRVRRHVEINAEAAAAGAGPAKGGFPSCRGHGLAAFGQPEQGMLRPAGPADEHLAAFARRRWRSIEGLIAGSSIL
ncbi:hypothetical protein NKI72_20800 [Mesorhizobium sp. M0437]|uniref:hypothetical protein n=1 Tax=Mesorhizobium sp. M0437 TaxID=2956945 RepID=UPI00333CCD0F